MTVNMMERPKGVHTVGGGEAEQEVPHHPTPLQPQKDPGGFSHKPWPLQTPFPPGSHGDTTHTAEAGRRKARCRSRGRADNIPRDLQRQQDQASGTRDPLIHSGSDPRAGRAQHTPEAPTME